MMTVVLCFLERPIDWGLCGDGEGSLPSSTENKVMEIYLK